VVPLSDDDLRAVTIGEPEEINAPIALSEYDPAWPERFRVEAARIGEALGDAALAIEHTGSTSVPGLAAKPVLDIVLVVANSADEGMYVPALEAVGYLLRIREPDWHEHRLLKRVQPAVNLHVFSLGSPEVARMLSFRDHLRANAEDRKRYEEVKRTLARRTWKYLQRYADAKTDVIEEILIRASHPREA
jgi:GrpB-like predicted nucleotidyltransferase (UPF0157 family)